MASQPAPTIAPGEFAARTRQRLRDFGRPPRIVALDIARGIAVIGMAAAHTSTMNEELRFSDPASWLELANGRPSLLFALLAGVSIALMTGRTQIPDRSALAPLRLMLLVRAMVIFCIGLVLELLGTPIAVILTFYGAIYAVAVMFIGMRPGRLLIGAIALACAGPALLAGIVALTPDASGSGVAFVVTGTYSIIAWVALMLIGLAWGRFNLTARKSAAVALLIGVVTSAIGYTVGAVWGPDHAGKDIYSSSSSSSDVEFDSYAPSLTPGDEVDLSDKVCEVADGSYVYCYPADEFITEDSSSSFDYDDGAGWNYWWDSVRGSQPGQTMRDAFLASSPHSGGTMEILGSGGLAIALTSLLLLTGTALRLPALPIAAIGSMPLTAYSAHVIAIWIVLGPGWSESGPHLFHYIAAGLLIACTAWALLVGRGPLERLTASVVARTTR